MLDEKNLELPGKLGNREESMGATSENYILGERDGHHTHRRRGGGGPK